MYARARQYAAGAGASLYPQTYREDEDYESDSDSSEAPPLVRYHIIIRRFLMMTQTGTQTRARRLRP